jgi:long-chain fatty acid transport protein
MKLRILIGILCLLLSLNGYASFIESTIGTAVVNDATASFYNPSALTLLNNQQIIALGSFANFRTHFSGQVLQLSTGSSQTGTSETQTNYFLPSFYYGNPVSKKTTIGLAVVSNFFNRDIEDNSIFRYVQTSNSIKSIDFVPALGFKINEFFSIGVAANFSYARFNMNPIVQFPALNIADTQSHNESNANGIGGDIGVLLKPGRTTLIGLNYQSSVTYRFNGSSTLESNPEVVSNNYRFTYWTPAREIFSINQQLNSALGLISTIQRIHWSIFQNIHINGIATPLGMTDASVPYYFHDAWLFTLGCHYRVTPEWLLRFATTYNQSPGNSSYQIVNGNSVILGFSTSYKINNKIILDGSYAHAFIQNANIDIQTKVNRISGVNKGMRDSVSVKLTVNV